MTGNNIPLTLQCFGTGEDVDTDTVIEELLRCPSEPLEVILESSENKRSLGANEEPLIEFRVSSNQAIMIADNLSVNEIEDAVNLSIVRVIFYEKVAHHQLFSTEKFY